MINRGEFQENGKMPPLFLWLGRFWCILLFSKGEKCFRKTEKHENRVPKDSRYPAFFHEKSLLAVFRTDKQIYKQERSPRRSLPCSYSSYDFPKSICIKFRRPYSPRMMWTSSPSTLSNAVWLPHTRKRCGTSRRMLEGSGAPISGKTASWRIRFIIFSTVLIADCSEHSSSVIYALISFISFFFRRSFPFGKLTYQLQRCLHPWIQ